MGHTCRGHAGEITDTKSTSGVLVAAKGLVTWAALEGGAKRQGATSRNTAEAELTSMADVTTKAALPLGTLWEVLLRRVVSILLRNDNSAAVLDVERGYSRALAYLVKPQRLSLGTLHEEFVEDPANAVRKADSRRMLADLLTKRMAPDRHWTLVLMLGMGFGAPGISPSQSKF